MLHIVEEFDSGGRMLLIVECEARDGEKIEICTGIVTQNRQTATMVASLG
jgi:hypothetical protein